jgi:hypothetical protein
LWNVSNSARRLKKWRPSFSLERHPGEIGTSGKINRALALSSRSHVIPHAFPPRAEKNGHGTRCTSKRLGSRLVCLTPLN